MNFLTGTFGQLLQTILGFVTRTVFIKVLGAEYLGIGGLFSNILQLLSLTQLGMDTAINFKLYKPLAEKDEQRVRILMKFYKNVYRVIGLVILVLGLAMIPALPVFIKDYDKLSVLKINAVAVFVLYLLQSVSSYLFFAYKSTIIKTDQKSYILNVVDYFINISQCVAQLVILLVWGDFMAYVATVVIFTLVKNGVNAWISQRMYAYAFEPEEKSMEKSEVIGIFKDCMALFLYKINNVVLKATDNIVLSAFIGLAIVGRYSNYVLCYSTIKHFLDKIYSSVKASMGNLYATGDMQKSYFMFEVMNYITVIFFGTGSVGLGICSNEFIDIWIGEDYLIPQPFPLLIGIELLLAGLKINLGQIRNISGAFRQMWSRPLWSVVVNVGVSVTLVQFIGIFGVVIGTIAADFLTNFMVDPGVIHRFSFNGYKPVSYYYKKNAKFFAILAVVYAVDYYLCGMIETGLPFLDLMIHASICGISLPAAYISIFWKTEVNQYLVSKVMKKARK